MCWTLSALCRFLVGFLVGSLSALCRLDIFYRFFVGSLLAPLFNPLFVSFFVGSVVGSILLPPNPPSVFVGPRGSFCPVRTERPVLSSVRPRPAGFPNNGKDATEEAATRPRETPIPPPPPHVPKEEADCRRERPAWPNHCQTRAYPASSCSCCLPMRKLRYVLPTLMPRASS